MDVPFLDLKTQNAALRDEILPLWDECLQSAGFVGGPHVTGFEEEFAKACDAEHAIAVSDGTSALIYIFEAIGLEPGDEVIVPANSFIATSEAVTKAGGKVVFVDVKPDTYNMDPGKLEAAITPKTKGIVPVHLYGQCAEMDAILAVAGKHGLWVVEDSAQAHLGTYKGRKAGSMGLAAGFSFYPGKNLGACGEAGAVTTNDADLAQKVRMLRDHGQAKKYYHDFEGYNGRCDALQAAALRVKLRHLPEWTAARRKHAAQYLELLKDAEGIVAPTVAADCDPVWHLFVVQVEDRDAVLEAMKARGVACALHYPVPLHLQKAYAHLGYGEGSLPVTEAYARRLLSLPMYAELTDEQVAYVCESLGAAVSEKAGARSV